MKRLFKVLYSKRTCKALGCLISQGKYGSQRINTCIRLGGVNLFLSVMKVKVLFFRFQISLNVSLRKTDRHIL